MTIQELGNTRYVRFIDKPKTPNNRYEVVDLQRLPWRDEFEVTLRHPALGFDLGIKENEFDRLESAPA